MKQNVQGADRRKPEADRIPPEWRVRVLKFGAFMAGLVAMAFMAAVMISEAMAQVPPSAPASAAANNCPGWKPGDPKCYLTEEHYAELERQIAALKATSPAPAARQAQPAPEGGQRFAPPPPADLSPLTEATNRSAEASERAAEAAEETRDAVQSLASDGPGNWLWYYGIVASGAVITQTGENQTPWLTRAEGFLRVIDPESHLGLETGVGAGPWFIDHHSAVAVGGRLAGVASWDLVGLQLGADLAHLQAPVSGDPGILLGTVYMAPEIHGDSVVVRALIGTTAKSEDARTSGLVLGLSLGGIIPVE